LHVTLLHWER